MRRLHFDKPSAGSRRAFSFSALRLLLHFKLLDLGPLRLLALKNGRGILRGLQAPPRPVALRALLYAPLAAAFLWGRLSLDFNKTLQVFKTRKVYKLRNVD